MLVRIASAEDLGLRQVRFRAVLQVVGPAAMIDEFAVGFCVAHDDRSGVDVDDLGVEIEILHVHVVPALEFHTLQRTQKSGIRCKKKGEPLHLKGSRGSRAWSDR